MDSRGQKVNFMTDQQNQAFLLRLDRIIELLETLIEIEEKREGRDTRVEKAILSLVADSEEFKKGGLEILCEIPNIRIDDKTEGVSVEGVEDYYGQI